MARKPRHGTANQYAKSIGVSRQRVSYLKKKGKLKEKQKSAGSSESGIDQDASARMHAERLAAQQRSPSRQIKDFYEAKMAKLEFEKAIGSLVDATMVRQGLKGVFIAQRTTLLSLSAQIGRDIDDAAVRRRVASTVDRCVRDALERIANYDPFSSDGEPDAEGQGTDQG